MRPLKARLEYPNDKNASRIKSNDCLADRCISGVDEEPPALLIGRIDWAVGGGSVLLKPPFPTKRLDSRVLRGYCGAQMIYGPGHQPRENPKAQAEEGYGPNSTR